MWVVYLYCLAWLMWVVYFVLSCVVDVGCILCIVLRG